jgi:hypothetical protein
MIKRAPGFARGIAERRGMMASSSNYYGVFSSYGTKENHTTNLRRTQMSQVLKSVLHFALPPRTLVGQCKISLQSADGMALTHISKMTMVGKAWR